MIHIPTKKNKRLTLLAHRSPLEKLRQHPNVMKTEQPISNLDQVAPPSQWPSVSPQASRLLVAPFPRTLPALGARPDARLGGQALLDVLRPQARRRRHVVEPGAPARGPPGLLDRPGELGPAGRQGRHDLLGRAADVLPDLPLLLLGQVEQDGGRNCGGFVSFSCTVIWSGVLDVDLLPPMATTTTTTMMATRAPWDSSTAPDVPPDAPAASSTAPPELAEPALASWPPVYGSSVASGKAEVVVVAIVDQKVDCLPKFSNKKSPDNEPSSMVRWRDKSIKKRYQSRNLEQQISEYQMRKDG